MSTKTDESRRDLVLNSTITFLFAGSPGLLSSLALDARAQGAGRPSRKLPAKMPTAPFSRSREGRGSVGPYGEVRVLTGSDNVLPIYIAARDNNAIADLRGGKFNIVFGKGSTAIRLNSKGINISGRIHKWDRAGIVTMMEAIVADRSASQGAMQLRAALVTSGPVAMVATGAGAATKAVAAAMNIAAKTTGAKSVIECSTRNVDEVVYRTVEETVSHVVTAEERLAQCISAAGDDVLAYLNCAAAGFVDLIVGTVKIVTEVATIVTSQVTTCVRKWVATWPNPFEKLPSLQLLTGLDFAAAPPDGSNPTPKDIRKALDILMEIPNLLGPVGKCLFDGKWSLAAAQTPIDYGSGNFEVPYGVRVCISDECADKLRISQTWETAGASWGAALSVLAAISPSFAGLVAGIGLPALPPAVVTALGVAAANPIILTIIAVILALALLMLYWSTAIAAQLEFAKAMGAFADGEVCLEHPAIAFGAFIAALVITPGINSLLPVTAPIAINAALLVPPIVVG